ncbi:ER degradation-enhancing alpha-mannosidase-like protein 2 [Nymphon striatum]|nr:ER degradation-enhancing alpha-mannosidase-like protein 2 [Nymphon striatum]
MFNYAYENYLHYAYPYDELRPLSCDGIDTWGKFSLTLIDALDTLAVIGNYSEFHRVVGIITSNINFDINVNVSVFETNIRVLGGLLSAHLLSKQVGLPLESGWPCSGPLLRLAEDIALRILPAFDTNTGMPYGTVNLRHGVPPGETTITCTAGVATFIVEFGSLSRLTGNPVFEEAAMKAMTYLWKTRSNIGLVGNHIDVQTGKWTASDAGIGAGVDSYFEYLVKGAILLQKPELMKMFEEYKNVITKYNKYDDWYLWVGMTHGKVSLPIFQSLEAFWPGLLSLVGDIDQATKTMHNYHQVWKQYGFTPEYYNIVQGEVYGSRDGYPLRPELVESAFYLHRATKDPFFLQIGMDIVESIEHSAKTPCGYATIKDVHSHLIEDRMESFFLAETTKYLYLLFDPNNFISKHHNPSLQGDFVNSVKNGKCIINAGGYIFNTEAHPIDISAVYCCSLQHKQELEDLKDIHDNINLYDTLSSQQNIFKNFKKKFHSIYSPTSTVYSSVLESDTTVDDSHIESDLNEKNSKFSVIKCVGESCSEVNYDSVKNTQEKSAITDPKTIDDKISEKYVNSSQVQISAEDDKGISNEKSEVEHKNIESASELGKPIQTVSIPTKLDGYFSTPVQKDKIDNNTIDAHYDVLMCSPQPFLLRLSLMGQMFYVN